MGAVLLGTERRWACPNCDQTAVTDDPRVHTRFHRCAGAGGFPVPMVEAGVAAKVELVERDDYIGDGVQRRDADGRPIMAARATTDQGEHLAVYPETAIARGDHGRRLARLMGGRRG